MTAQTNEGIESALNKFVGTKVVLAKAMTLGEYNEYRGWPIPENEDPSAEGYLVEYPGTVPNDSAHAGYISWSPKVAFDDSHVMIYNGPCAPSNEILRFFEYSHLPLHLQGVSKLFGLLAQQMESIIPNGAEKSAGLRKLLEAKDCFVRASLPVKK